MYRVKFQGGAEEREIPAHIVEAVSEIVSLSEPVPSTLTFDSPNTIDVAPGPETEPQLELESRESNCELRLGVECENSPVPPPTEASTDPDGLFVAVQLAVVTKFPFPRRLPSFPLRRSDPPPTTI
ncbi:MAG TPA: hypothetical protein VIL58_06000 [Thermoplasmata archaeon]